MGPVLEWWNDEDSIFENDQAVMSTCAQEKITRAREPIHSDIEPP